ncbi:MAG: hypothetical protein A2275_02595 [Bacteroidetes bacterium RIFOXYA12_FULL_35_11]|nr:MAG: hypothetical protein A2X01_07005 [Bacteroidetes bacterium GWF2_35_48]OFY82090.1 MAG: hypothetical protein A2275_02595 [Bacteroidetes bacterium RIFOXYA12_FULL_35_11]OFY97780.1 MAG: hypothetical protein A2309_08520 [Bacteroidetes bacterium RIFOXYB2_FULL_35_7]OFZ06162.1 MAG: hypothetical protein A2491_14275 [Bacteroidetes bacterium RIFOXYC12_FULL_35_7]HBX53134.1 hypothetical protein [Bacteroidales bacterium]
MKNILLSGLCLVFALSISAQEADFEAPINPDFLKYQKNIYENKIPAFSELGHPLNEIPLYVKPDFTNYLKQQENKSVMFDAVYDMRNHGLLTSVKNQGNCGACWTFASIGSLESYSIKTGFGTFNFSEQNVRTCHGFYLDPASGTCSGGNPKKSAAYFTRGDGPVLETADPYNTNSQQTCNTTLTPAANVNNFCILPGTQNVIKQALLDYGALYTNMMYSSAYLNSSNNTYFYAGTEGTNHAVLLAGWDDNKVTAGGTGAWIIKNSYGTSWGENGYFYVSYNDSAILTTNAYFPSIGNYDAYEEIYMYDELGWISNIGYTSEVAYGLIKFIAGSNEKITKVGTYINSAGASISFEIYDTKTDNTLSGLLASVPEQQCAWPGYHTFSLPQQINISSGNDFYIKVRYNTPGYNYPLPIERLSTDYAEPQIADGVCWASSSGTTWTAYGASQAGKERDLCIRAYTLPQGTDEKLLLSKTETVEVFPNPAQNAFTIKSDVGAIIKIEMMNSEGKLVSKIEPDQQNTKFEFNTSALSSGVYFLRIVTKNNTYFRKITLIE